MGLKPSMVNRAVVISIHPKFAEAILSGTKQVELRKHPFPKDITEVVMYVTSPVRYILGKFSVEKITVNTPAMVWLMTEGKNGIDLDAFIHYYDKKKWAVAIIVRGPIRFKTPVDPDKYIKNWTPPQNFRYITWKEYDRIVAAGSRPAGGSTPPMEKIRLEGAGSGRGSDSPPSPACPDKEVRP